MPTDNTERQTSDTKIRTISYPAILVIFNVKGADEFITFCKDALGAEELMRKPGPNNAVGHADLKLGDTIVAVSDSIKDAPTSVVLAYFVADPDAVFEKAVRLGARALSQPGEAPFGGRWARIEDRWGNRWTLTTRPAATQTESKGD